MYHKSHFWVMQKAYLRPDMYSGRRPQPSAGHRVLGSSGLKGQEDPSLVRCWSRQNLKVLIYRPALLATKNTNNHVNCKAWAQHKRSFCLWLFKRLPVNDNSAAAGKIDWVLLWRCCLLVNSYFQQTNYLAGFIFWQSNVHIRQYFWGVWYYWEQGQPKESCQEISKA